MIFTFIINCSIESDFNTIILCVEIKSTKKLSLYAQKTNQFVKLLDKAKCKISDNILDSFIELCSILYKF